MGKLIITTPVFKHSAIAATQPQVIHETIRAQFVDTVFVPAAKKAGVWSSGSSVYEDGLYDAIDYHKDSSVVNYPTWHLVASKGYRWNTSAIVGCAADLNVVNTNEEAWFKKVIVPQAKNWGLGYYWEKNHLHIDVGQWSNNGTGWFKGGWEGKPNFSVTGIQNVDGIAGPNFIKGLQRLVGASQDGQLGPKTTRALQSWANKKLGSRLVVDGIFGPKSSYFFGNYLTGAAWGSSTCVMYWQIRINGTISSSLSTRFGSYNKAFGSF